MQTNIEDNVISLFRQKGFEKHQNLTQQIVSRVFNQQSQLVFHEPFKNDMLVQLVNQCRCEKLQLTPRGIGQIISSAHGILSQRLKVLQGPKGLISDRKTLLSNLQQKSKIISETVNKGYYQRQQTNQIETEYASLSKQLEQLQTNQKIFSQQFLIIDELFRKNVSNKKRKDGKSDQYVQPNVKNLTYTFFMAVTGVFLEFFGVMVRAGWIGIAIYLQTLFFVLIGYYHKKAVMFLVLSGITSIALDLAAIFLFEVFLFKHVLYVNPDDNFQKVLNYIYLTSFILSIITRIAILFTCYPFIQPPLKKLTYTIFNTSLTLNTRLRTNSTRMSGNYSQN